MIRNNITNRIHKAPFVKTISNVSKPIYLKYTHLSLITHLNEYFKLNVIKQ